MSERCDMTVDISNCDREPIHIPGAIQPHGALLAVQEPQLTIVQVSENISVMLDTPAADLAGIPLSAVLDADAFAAVQQATTRDHLAEINPLRLEVGGREYDTVLHRHRGVLILEFEPEASTAGQRTHHPLRRVVSSLQAARTLPELLTAGAAAVRQLTGFDRVMIYSFDEDGHGSVVADARCDALEPYLGLHYPASDIPKQARELYLRNTIRSIPDGRYTPVPLVPTLRPDTGAPLDLSYAVLRSVSPIHLEYIANMGIRASLSISLVVRGRLWGLVSCAHHSGPHHVPFDIRSDCEVVGHTMSLLIGAFEDRDIAAWREQRRPLLDALADAARSREDVLLGLLAKPQELLAVLRLDGAGVVADDVHGIGRAPGIDQIRAVSQWLPQTTSGVFTTDALAKMAPQFLAIKDVASGIVSFSLPGAVPRRFIGFRPEIVQTVNWGGDPRKPIQLDTAATLHPRRSFALWREEVQLHSLRWSAPDRDAAMELRRLVVEIDLERQVERAQRAVKARDDLVAVVSHDLKNPLNVIQMQAVLLRNLVGVGLDEPSLRLRASLDRVQRSVTHMDALVHDLQDLARIEAGRFAVRRQSELLDEMLGEALVILRPLAEAKRQVLHDPAEAGVTVLADRERVFQVLSNLVGNAIKFTPAGGRIALHVTVEADRVVVAVSDSGPGLAPEQLTQVFDRYWQASDTAREGTGLGLYIARGIVEAHGGRIWAESAAGSGATFKFTLPLAAVDAPA